MKYKSSCCYLINVMVFILAFFLVKRAKSSTMTGPLKLEEILPAGYDNLRTPRVGDGPAQVSLTLVIVNIRNVDVSEMSIRFDLMLTKRWMDERLQFPSQAQENKVVLNIEWRKSLWMPDVFFENSIEGHVQDTIIPNMYLWLFKNKTIQFTARVSIEFSCQMDLRLFPHDTQECDMIVMSLTHTEDEMKLVWDKNLNVTQGDNIVLPQFEIVGVDSDECKKGAHFSCLRGIVTLTRRSGYYITNVYIPTSLIVFMSMLSFWIPPDAVPARVTLGVTSLLTIVTKQYQASLPNVSYIVALNIWLSACIGFVFVSLLEYATVIALHTSIKRKTKPVPTVTEQIRVIHKVLQPDALPDATLNLVDQELLFVWTIPFNFSDVGDPDSSKTTAGIALKVIGSQATPTMTRYIHVKPENFVQDGVSTSHSVERRKDVSRNS